ncbi:MAG: acyl-CoA ligase (AMP-forming), exosortase A system-associated [Gammaproteobacteria bacterium]|jgi:acyl-CoA ligase (AMP-forming) (exosortase A-associated)|nr:acyl-CoA ligase (AMP-forming), exosortase A system-associated [Gammaproteobacteria bacterium]
MGELLHDLLRETARRTPGSPALAHRAEHLDYGTLWSAVDGFARGLVGLGLQRSERVAVYLPKQVETVVALFGAAAAGGVFVPVNPVLKAAQVAYLLQDCNVRVLVTSADRAAVLADVLAGCHDLRWIVLVDGDPGALPPALARLAVRWLDLLAGQPGTGEPHRRIDADVAAILYTSGSTGRPKGVVLSHRNMVAGARSVAEYLENHAEDRLLAVLPLSFDYGLSQLTTAFSVGASVVLLEYLLPRDVVAACAKGRITGLAAVPPLWNQLARLPWPDEAVRSLRYITNSGGAMPRATTAALRAALPDTRVFLMYGLTEAFRSTYLPPDQVTTRPDSIGKAIPNAEILVVREDGTECAPGEPGELVHRGALVGLGYWNDPEKTAQRYRPAPGQPPELPNPELAVWSGDQVRRDADGYLYFVSRKDEMIKTSGYRVSPTEVEEVVYASGLAAQTAAVGAAHPELGQAIVLVVQPTRPDVAEQDVLDHCRRELPNFMVPAAVFLRAELPRNQNGKIDRKTLAGEFAALFAPNGGEGVA